MNLILLHPTDFQNENTVLLHDHRAQHIQKILKAVPGKKLRIGCLNGSLGEGEVLEIHPTSVVLKCQFSTKPPPKPQIDLLLAMPRPKVLKRLWAQFAALGVGRIVLLNAEKVERYYFDTHILQAEFYTPRIIEGVQQAGCTHLPEVLIRPRFKPFVEDELNLLFPKSTKILADPQGTHSPLSFFQKEQKPERILLAIGPEGGWSSYEIDLFSSKGFKLMGLGSRILRTDTASIALLSMLSEWIRYSSSP
jgi:RsmE family RNA methyltransferase